MVDHKTLTQVQTSFVSEEDFAEAPTEASSASATPPVDIHPRTLVARLHRDYTTTDLEKTFAIELIAALTGMSVTYIRHALEQTRSDEVTLQKVLFLLDLDSFAETFVPRSQIPQYLLGFNEHKPTPSSSLLTLPTGTSHQVVCGSARDLIPQLAPQSVQCVVTSTPYWGTRLYQDVCEVSWADGEKCPFGHEQTPEGFIRHTIELLYLLKPAITNDGSIWWNLMDTYNTRTQIRTNAAETLLAMQGRDSRGWKDYACRRYSAGHSFLEDGEQCMIPTRVAERASRIGYWTKSIITWKKNNSMPETVGSRVAREAEYIIHLAVQRSPYFNKAVYSQLPVSLGGRHPSYEAEKITDIWCLPTSNGLEGHGAQFPLALPGRCIALSTRAGDLVVDPFIGSGTTAVAALQLGRHVIGMDVSETYLAVAREHIATTTLAVQVQMLLEHPTSYTDENDVPPLKEEI